RLVERGAGQAVHQVDGLGGAVQLLAVEPAGRVRVLLASCRHAVTPSWLRTPGSRLFYLCFRGPYLTAIPMDRAVPRTWSFAASMSLALRSGILIRAISSSWVALIVPARVRPAVWDPFSTPAA